MKWKIISKRGTKQPLKGTYTDWKEILAEEGAHQCAYCAILESSFGGPRNFHVDHYRPKSKFSNLENDIANLFYACAICNGFKSDDWPNEPAQDHSNIAYPNPSENDYNDLIDVDLKRGSIHGRFIASRYVIEKLYLNRPQLMLERRAFGLLQRLDDFCNYFLIIIPRLVDAARSGSSEASTLLAKLSTELAILHLLRNDYQKIRPYKSSDIKRPA